MQKEPRIQNLPRNTILDHFQLREVIASDGYSITYKAWDTKRIRLVMIKEFFPVHLANRDENSSLLKILTDHNEQYQQDMEHFLAQAKVLLTLDHPNIITVIDYFQQNNTAYLCMNFEQGQSLNQLMSLELEKLPDEELKSIFKALITALKYIHEQDVYHKNIQLNNIYIRKDGTPFIFNFVPVQPDNAFDLPGISDRSSEKNKSYINHSSQDLYALGVAMYHYICSTEPINLQTRIDAILKNNHDPVTPASELGNNVYSSRLLQLIDWMIRPEEKDRPQHPSLILDKLESDIADIPLPNNIEINKDYSDSLITTVSQVEQEPNIEEVPIKSLRPKTWLLISGLCSIFLIVFALNQKHILENFFSNSPNSKQKTIDQNNISLTSSNETNSTNESGLESISNNTLNKQEKDIKKVISKKLLETIIENRVEEELAKIDSHNNNNPSTQKLISLTELEKIVDSRIENELVKRKQQNSTTQSSHPSYIQTTPITQTEHIEFLLKKAEKDLKRMRLSTPKGNNALEKYQAIIELSPENKMAQLGINKISDKYLQLVEKHSEEHDYRKAKYYLDKAKTIQPKNNAIYDAEKNLKTSIANYIKPQPSTINTNKATNTAKQPSTPINIEMIWVNPDCFQMGDNDIYAIEHKVCLTKGYYLGKYEVTQSQWKHIMGENPSVIKGNNKPVQNVSWNNVQTFIRKLNDLSGKNYRLPTEAEWEYACRSGGKKMKYCGSNNAERVAWYKDNAGNTIHSVGQKQPNSLGLYDMSGNVWEWIQDYYQPDFYNNSPVNNPKGPLESSGHVVRGGSWFSGKGVLRSAYRVWYAPGIRVSYLGFRLAR